MRPTRAIAAWMALLVIAVGAKADPLVPFAAEYIGYRGGSEVGRATQSLVRLDDGRYRMSYHSKASKFIFSDKRWENSEFTYADGVFNPLRYNYKRRGTGKSENVAIAFDADNGAIIREGREPLEWQGELDHLLYRYDFQLGLASGKPKLAYQIINYRGDKRRYGYEVLETEQLSLPYGDVKAIKVKVIRENPKRQTYLWFAPVLDFLMVRLQQFKSGKEQFDIHLQHYQFTPITASPDSEQSHRH